MTVAETAIATYLASLGYGTTGSTIFVNIKPATPDNLIVVFGYAGQAPDYVHDTSLNARPGIQVWVRDTSAATARTTIENIFNSLDGIANTSLSGLVFEGIFANQSPQYMGKDENRRTEFVVNFSTIVRR